MRLDVDGAIHRMYQEGYPFSEDYQAALESLGVYDLKGTDRPVPDTLVLVYLLIERVVELQKKIDDISKNNCTQ
jgi:hypothetical protein